MTALTDGDIDYFYTQGNIGGSDGSAAQADPDGSLGGFRSTTEFVDNTEEKLCDIFSLAEADAGKTVYRCLAVRNVHASEHLVDARLVLANLPSSSDITIEVATHAPGDGTTAAAVAANETTAPAATSFVAASGKTVYADGYGINAGSDADLEDSHNCYIWFKITLAASTERINTALANGTINFRVDGVN